MIGGTITYNQAFENYKELHGVREKWEAPRTIITASYDINQHDALQNKKLESKSETPKQGVRQGRGGMICG